MLTILLMSLRETYLTKVIHTNAISEVHKLIYRLTGLNIEETTISNLEMLLRLDDYLAGIAPHTELMPAAAKLPLPVALFS